MIFVSRKKYFYFLIITRRFKTGHRPFNIEQSICPFSPIFTAYFTSLCTNGYDCIPENVSPSPQTVFAFVDTSVTLINNLSL